MTSRLLAQFETFRESVGHDRVTYINYPSMRCDVIVTGRFKTVLSAPNSYRIEAAEEGVPCVVNRNFTSRVGQMADALNEFGLLPSA